MEKTSRLSMLDEHGGRRAIIPAEVKGRYRTYRNRVHTILFLIFLGLPWIEINGRQLVLLDIPNRRFEIFGKLFLAHDAPILFFLIALFALGLMLSTALWGRIWCGWACPQTVFIDAVYRRIERWVEGGYLERRKLAAAPMDFRKFSKLSIKWIAFVAVSSVFAHSFIAYFTGGSNLLNMISGSPSDNWNYFLLVSIFTAVTAFNFGWFREQFCIIMCPYGRFQNVLMDSHSLNITYDRQRGEPRRGEVPVGTKQGDCIACNRCVLVCPTGIDIRNGLQLECINCTACMDVCDETMSKVNKPPGLIAYSAAIPKTKVRIFRSRIVAYLVLIALFTTGMAVTLHNRQPYSIMVLRAKDSPYEVTAEGTVMNHFRLHLLNQSHESQKFQFAVGSAFADSNVKLMQAAEFYELAPGQSKEIHLFVNFPKSILDPSGHQQILVRATEMKSGELKDLEFSAIGPNRNN